MSSPFTCMGRALAALTSATLIYAASWILTISGLLFNWLVENTIIQFAAWYDSIHVAVEQAWSAFRDIANILIIGIFTFTAISIILGIKEYGQKKTIAKVLVIAILINFSLLFAKIIVDASNYTATQIYNAAGLNTGNTANQSVGAGQQSGAAASSGIAGTFIDLLGVRGFGNSLQSINDIAEARDNGWIALMHGILVFAILGGAALVLLYGAFLLLSRALMIIFLFITASLAFATYLVPKLAATKVGWDTWWSSLLKSAALAPLLMFFLWATLNIAYNLVGPVGSASRDALGDIVTSPDGTASLNAVVSYLMILGLLFITFRLSSSFASGITNFNFAQGLAISPLTLGSRAAGWAIRRSPLPGRLTVLQKRREKDAAAASLAATPLLDRERRYSNLAKRAKAEGRDDSVIRRLEGMAQRAGVSADEKLRLAASKARSADRYGKATDSKFNLLNTEPAKKVLEQIGIKGFAAGATSKDAKSYAGRLKEDIKKAEDIGKTLSVSPAQEADIRANARGEELARRLERREMKELQRDNTKKITDAVQSAAKTESAAIEKDIESARTEYDGKQAASEDNERVYGGNLANLTTRVQEGTAAPAEIDALKARRESEMRQEAADINHARDRVKELEKQRDAFANKKFTVVVDGRRHQLTTGEAEKAVKDLDAEIAKLAESSNETKQAVQKAGDAEVSRARQAADAAKEEVGRQHKWYARTPQHRERVASKIRSDLSKQTGSKKILDTLSEALKAEGGGISPKPEDKKDK
ncbi:MAG: hypothetical protein NUV59_02840 [Patescibacteria group bacterium]|nr:hypothetical protein [Patescibacteria group bacterium]